MFCITWPVARSTCQICPEKTSPVQNEVPLGSMAPAKSPPSHPDRVEHGKELITFPYLSSSKTALESATRTSPLAMILTSKARSPGSGVELNAGNWVLVHLLYR